MQTRFGWLIIRDRGSFWRLTGVLFLTYLSTGLWSPLMAVYTGSLGATTAEIGIVLAMFQTTSLASQYWWGRRSDRLGRRKPLLLIGTAGLALAYVLIALISSWGLLIPARMLEGLALAAYNTGSLALVGDVLEDQAGRGRLMGLYRTFGSLAFSIAALSGGLLADNFGIKLPFVVAACCYVLAFLLATTIKERSNATKDEARKTQDGQGTEAPPADLCPSSPVLRPETPNPLARRALWPFLGLTFTWMFGMGSVVSLWPVYMSTLGYSKTAVGGLWALAAAGEVIWLMVAGTLADRWGRKAVMLTGLVTMAGIYTSYTFASSLIWFVLIQMVRSFAYSCFEAPSLLYATELGLRQQRGRLAGLYYSASGLGGIIGSVVGGVVAGVVGLPTMYRCIVVVMLIVAVVVARTMPRLRTGEHRPTAADAQQLETARR